MPRYAHQGDGQKVAKSLWDPLPLSRVPGGNADLAEKSNVCISPRAPPFASPFSPLLVLVCADHPLHSEQERVNVPKSGAAEMDTHAHAHTSPPRPGQLRSNVHVREWEAVGHSGRGKMVTVVVGSSPPACTPRVAFSPSSGQVNAEPEASRFSMDGEHRVSDGKTSLRHSRFADGVEGTATLQLEDVESPQLSSRRCVRGGCLWLK